MIPSQRHLFDIPRDVAWLNCAYMSPLANAARDAGLAALAAKSRPWTVPPSDFFSGSEALRARFARLIGAAADDIALIPSVSYGMAIVTRNLSLEPDRSLLVMAEEFPSPVFALRKLAEQSGASLTTVPRPADGDWTAAVLDHLRPGVALAALSHTHWVCGGMLDLVAIGARCREIGAELALDLTQSAGALPFDVAAVDPDYVVAAAYKWLMGPYALGFLYVAPRHQNGEPLEQGWIARAGAEDFRRLIDYSDKYAPGARRFDMGERSHFVATATASAALDQLLAWDVAAISATLGAHNRALAERLAPLGVHAHPEPLRSPHYLGLKFDRPLPDDLLPALAAAGVHVSIRGDWMRVTRHLYNDAEDDDRFAVALAANLR
ncbi:MAG: aminotransferase class V-fold PLP-dependent enzyme, partial [Sphingomicrobium sp.]